MSDTVDKAEAWDELAKKNAEIALLKKERIVAAALEADECTGSEVMEIETYMHHGKRVSVKPEFKGKHRDICLCYGCAYFAPGTDGNCAMAQTLFDFCKEHGGTAIRQECPSFEHA